MGEFIQHQSTIDRLTFPIDTTDSTTNGSGALFTGQKPKVRALGFCASGWSNFSVLGHWQFLECSRTMRSGESSEFSFARH